MDIKSIIKKVLNELDNDYMQNAFDLDDIPTEDDDTVTNNLMNSLNAPKTRKALDKLVIEYFIEYGPNADMNSIDVSAITNFSSLFDITGGLLTYDWIATPGSYFDRNGISFATDEEKSEFLMNANPDVSKWKVSNAESMSYMFRGCTKFNRDLSNWDVSHVFDFHSTFSLCISFTGAGLSNWADKLVKSTFQVPNSFYRMFYGCSAFKEDLSSWTIKLPNIDNAYYSTPKRIKNLLGFIPVFLPHIYFSDCIYNKLRNEKYSKLFKSCRFPAKFLPKIIYV